MVKKRGDFVGRVLSQRPGLTDPERPHLVGLRPVIRGNKLRAGAQLVETGSTESLGWVTSVTRAVELEGWIGLAGPYDFLPIRNPEVRPVFFYPDSPPDSQPINHVSRGAPPALLIASDDDSLVNPQRNTGGLASKLRAAGVPVQEFYFSRTGHATLVAALSRPLRGLAPVLDRVSGFVESTPTQ